MSQSHTEPEKQIAFGSQRAAGQKIELIKGLTFDQWKRLLDQEVSNLCGLTSDDLPDCDYWNWWHDGLRADRAAKRAFKQAQDF